MTESTLTSQFLKEVRRGHPAWVVDKVNDRVAHGRPDANITGHGRIMYIEFKKCDTPSEVQQAWKKLTPKQEVELRLRSAASFGRAFLFAFVPGGHRFDRRRLDVWWNGRRVLSNLSYREGAAVVEGVLTSDVWFRSLVEAVVDPTRQSPSA